MGYIANWLSPSIANRTAKAAKLSEVRLRTTFIKSLFIHLKDIKSVQRILVEVEFLLDIVVRAMESAILSLKPSDSCPSTGEQAFLLRCTRLIEWRLCK